MADAVERSLPNVPDYDAFDSQRTIDLPFPVESEIAAALLKKWQIDPHVWWSGSNKPLLVEFIAFCRAGGFQIR